MEKMKILVVDDESRMRKLVRDFLEREGFQVFEAGDGMEAMDIFYENRDIALIILDVMMPRMDGWQVCREVRQSSRVPIIMLTARGEERDELQGFSLGVDEYISKPFSPKILVARVEAILRRTRDAQAQETLEAGGIELDKTAHIVKLDGEPVELTFKEYSLLHFFLEHPEEVLARERIMKAVWDTDDLLESRTIDMHVRTLRQKLGHAGDAICTVRKVGYKLSAKGTEAGEDA